jgi:hypothetical protein
LQQRDDDAETPLASSVGEQPPQKAMTTPGPREAMVIAPTDAALPVSLSMSHPAATSCIQLPTVVAAFAATRRRNSG